MSDDTAKPVDAAAGPDEPPSGGPPQSSGESSTDSEAAEQPKTSVQGERAEPKEGEPPAEAQAGAATPAPQSGSETEAGDERAALDDSGRERPRFLLAFPEDPALARLTAAFEAGNYALVRAEAEALAERTENPAVKGAALELRRRIEPDPLAKYLLALTLVLLLSLAYFAYHH